MPSIYHAPALIGTARHDESSNRLLPRRRAAALGPALKTLAALQHVLPKHAISRLAGVVANSRTPWIAQPLIRAFMRAYGVNLSEAAATEPAAYRSFNDFFSRALAARARPMPDDASAIASPADGRLAEFGFVEAGHLLQAKGHRYAATELLTDADLAKRYEGGAFFTVYLAPRDYHRVHAPANGRLLYTVEVPGRLFAVNEYTSAAVPRLFARNERLVCVFDGFAIVLVGAMIVGGIRTAWGGAQSPYRTLRTRVADRRFERGEELAGFLLGSTVVALFPPGGMAFGRNLTLNMPVRMGQALGTIGG